MPAFASPEEELLKKYLDKDHAYRHKEFTAIHRAVIDDNFGYFSGEAFAASGWKNMDLWLVRQCDSRRLFHHHDRQQLPVVLRLWRRVVPGSLRVGSTADFANSDLQGVFTLLFGSYFGDWIHRIISSGRRLHREKCWPMHGADVPTAVPSHGAGREHRLWCKDLSEQQQFIFRKLRIKVHSYCHDGRSDTEKWCGGACIKCHRHTFR